MQSPHVVRKALNKAIFVAFVTRSFSLTSSRDLRKRKHSRFRTQHRPFSIEIIRSEVIDKILMSCMVASPLH